MPAAAVLTRHTHAHTHTRTHAPTQPPPKNQLPKVNACPFRDRMGCSSNLALPSAAARALLLGMLGALLSAWPSSVSASGYEAAFLHKPALVGRSNYTHFWMITSSTPTSLLPSASIRLEIMLHGDSGPWGKCPNPRHPQNCTAQYTNRGGEWRDIMQTDNPIPCPFCGATLDL